MALCLPPARVHLGLAMERRLRPPLLWLWLSQPMVFMWAPVPPLAPFLPLAITLLLVVCCACTYLELPQAPILLPLLLRPLPLDPKPLPQPLPPARLRPWM